MFKSFDSGISRTYDSEVSLFQLETAHLGPSKLGVSDALTLRAAGHPRFIGVQSAPETV